MLNKHKAQRGKVKDIACRGIFGSVVNFLLYFQHIKRVSESKMEFMSSSMSCFIHLAETWKKTNAGKILRINFKLKHL